ncbi:MAG: pyridoxamine 5'-phosphate oxidase family protein [Thermoplasmata archaeon]|nr:pyridoxamine 5'-phosphate oxidase family protein [Thermoplasmata archaeon]
MQPNMQKFQLSDDEITALLDRAPSAVISTIGEDGYPYGTPINFVRMDGRIFFHGRKVGEKVGNLKRDPRCCLTVVEESGFERCGDGACDTTTLYESVIVRGKVSVVEDPELKAKVLRATVDKLTPARRMDGIDAKKVPPTGIYEIIPESVTGKYHRPMAGHETYPVHPQ